MHRYQATIRWNHTVGVFSENKYSRKHDWVFDGDLEIPASASPKIVPEPYSDPSAVDPEEAFVASLASCHMLWFLSLAAKNGYTVKNYSDTAEGIMEKNKEGKLAITEVILKPLVMFEQNNVLNNQVFDELHNKAHQNCFIARSVKAEISIDGQFEIS
jgi:organic hydroperoxide reductase OsmC/OhrA